MIYWLHNLFIITNSTQRNDLYLLLWTINNNKIICYEEKNQKPETNSYLDLNSRLPAKKMMKFISELDSVRISYVDNIWRNKLIRFYGPRMKKTWPRKKRKDDIDQWNDSYLISNESESQNQPAKCSVSRIVSLIPKDNVCNLYNYCEKKIHNGNVFILGTW